MRVIAGRAKGHKLKSPEGLLTRPTADRVKESLFNILGSRIYDSRVLDLFGGSGALAIEAASRGALHCDVVEKLPEAVKVIRENIAHTKLEEFISVMHQSWDTFLSRPLSMGYDIILLDPPYHKDFLEPVLLAVMASGALNPGGIIVYERDDGEHFTVPEPFSVKDERRYGRTVLTFLEYES